MLGGFGLVALTGAVAVLVGANYRASGRIEKDIDEQSELLASFRSVGNATLRIGQVLLALGIIGMAVCGFSLLVT